MQESQQRPLVMNMNSLALPPSLPPAESARRRVPAKTATAAAGEPVNDSAVPRAGQAHASTATRNGRHVWIIVAIVLIVAILAGIGVWAWRTQPRPHPDASAQQPTSEVQPTPSESMDGGETGGAADEERPRESAAEQQAHDELQRQVEADKAKAVGLLNVYTTQLSSKKPACGRQAERGRMRRSSGNTVSSRQSTRMHCSYGVPITRTTPARGTPRITTSC